MSYKKDKEKAIRIKEHKKKCCRYCSQLFRGRDGNFRCGFLKSKNDIAGAYLLVNATDIDRPRKCFDEYNGLNLL